ncbi:MAG: hypothetical protein V8R81_06135 [Clostridia bacterium]
MEPVTTLLVLIPTLEQIHSVTSALSPVKTTTRIPALFNFSIEDFAVSLADPKIQ